MDTISHNIKLIVIGGSAGSFKVVTKILSELPADFKLPILLCLHRLKHVREGFVEALSLKSNIPVVEPYDKEKILKGKAYLAPSNYHMYLEMGNTIALSTDEPVNFSRPSIDLTYGSAGFVLKNKVLGIILSGANKDGADGMRKIHVNGGKTIIQSPEEASVKTMPKATLDLIDPTYVMNTEEIITYLKTL